MKLKDPPSGDDGLSLEDAIKQWQERFPTCLRCGEGPLIVDLGLLLPLTAYEGKEGEEVMGAVCKNCAHIELLSLTYLKLLPPAS